MFTPQPFRYSFSYNLSCHHDNNKYGNAHGPHFAFERHIGTYVPIDTSSRIYLFKQTH